jgi:hypothetical protein
MSDEAPVEAPAEAPVVVQISGTTVGASVDGPDTTPTRED